MLMLEQVKLEKAIDGRVKMTPDEFLEWISPSAKEVCNDYGLPWQVVVAQGAVESQWGLYGVGNEGYNLFGRKWGNWGEFVEVQTEECYEGKWTLVTDKFQSYESFELAMIDWCELMIWKSDDGSVDYKQFSDQYKIDGDIRAFARGISYIYATDPEYANKIIDTMEACDLIGE